jgi:hypothetical protein
VREGAGFYYIFLKFGVRDEYAKIQYLVTAGIKKGSNFLFHYYF